jgi:stage II sporulation protein D
VVLVRDRGGITIVNTLGLEDYLRGVVGAELGRRDPQEEEALVAQAIVSRTFAIRNLGKRAEQGFDLYGSTIDQVYAGAAAEYPMAVRAVDRTAGLVLTWNGAPIDAFFFSTCAGRTADGTEVFAGADRPYLTSVADRDGSGDAYCRISPRYHWREEWTGEELRGVLRQSLPLVSTTTAADVDEVRGVTVDRQTRSGRVAQVTVTLAKREVSITGPAIRQALHPVGQEVMRSALFELHQTIGEGRITGLVAEGHGAGHGVGFCQWGAVGRARAGQSAATMLAAYFPGTEISRAY